MKKARCAGIRLPLILSLLLVLGTLCGCDLFNSAVEPGRILENVTVAGVDVGGMKKQEAVDAVRTAVENTYTATPLTVTVMQTEYTLSPSESGAALDVESAVEAAYSCGRSGSRSNRKEQQQQALTDGIQIDILPYLQLDTDAVRKFADSIAADWNRPVTDAVYDFSGTKPSLDGDSVDPGSLRLHILLGSPGYQLDADALHSSLLQSYNRNQLQLEGACTLLEPAGLDLDAIYAESCTDPVDAVMDMQTFEVSSHSYGYRFSLEDARKAITSGTYGQEFTFDFQKVAPEVTYEALASMLFRDELSTYTAYAGSNPDRNVNLKLSCQAINGIVLMPGEVFSYNPALGERTPEAGYRPADGYVGMETVTTYGGGICQASSSLYYCAMVADLEIVERYNHGFISAYMPYGMDATVSWGGPEFRFRNSSDYPIRIEAYASGGTVTVKLIGTDTKDYYVKMEYEVLEVIPYKTVEMEMEADNEKGYKDGDTVISPYTGYKVKTYRCKYSKQTDQLISREFEVASNYSARDHVVCKIKPAETQPPETTAPAETVTSQETTVPQETTAETVG